MGKNPVPCTARGLRHRSQPKTQPQVVEANARRVVQQDARDAAVQARINCGVAPLREFYEALCATSRAFRERWKQLSEADRERLIYDLASEIYSCPGRLPQSNAYGRREKKDDDAG